MAVGPEQERDVLGTRIEASHRLAARADARLTGAIADIFLPDDARLDERTRLALRRVLDGVIAAIEAEIRRHAARILSGRGAADHADQLLNAQATVAGRLTQAGVLRDRLLIDELLSQVRCDLIAERLSPTEATPDQASLLVRLTDVDDGVVAAAARALLSAETRRRAAAEQGGVPGGILPAERHHQLVWWVAAAIRDGLGTGDGLADRAIIEAAQRNLAAHDEGQRPEAAAVRLAAAIDARPHEIGDLLVETLGDRRLLLFIAVLARAVDLDFEAARTIVLEPEGDRLWLALRVAEIDRQTIARIALMLADADPRRDIEAFADDLDAIVAVPAEGARAALAPLSLHHDMRLALAALARGDAR